MVKDVVDVSVSKQKEKKRRLTRFEDKSLQKRCLQFQLPCWYIKKLNARRKVQITYLKLRKQGT